VLLQYLQWIAKGSSDTTRHVILIVLRYVPAEESTTVRSQFINGIRSGEAESAARAVLSVGSDRQLVAVDAEAAGLRTRVHQRASSVEREIEYWRGAEEHAPLLLVLARPVVLEGACEL
ncbi:hypothetical protein PENTCL1PPCAC_21630, partial [Pristionchus entomophagus]